MGMVDRYKKSGGFLQLVQVIETCSPKKYEQFMTIISEESPSWAEALNEKCITFDKILSWRPEVVLEIIASVNTLSFAAALKSLPNDALDLFLQKLSHQERKKIEIAMQESNPNPNEISASVIKVISETRALFVQNTIKVDKVDPKLVIPDDYEDKLQKTDSGKSTDAVVAQSGSDSSNYAGVVISTATITSEIDKLQKKLVLLSKEVQSLRGENQVMKDKLDRIKKIA